MKSSVDIYNSKFTMKKTAKSKKGAPKPKGKPKTAPSKDVETAEKSIQVYDPTLINIKDKINQSVQEWMESNQTKIVQDDEPDSVLELIEDLNRHLKNVLNKDERKIRLVKQVRLELEASLTFTIAAAYFKNCEFGGFAKFFNKLSDATMNLIFGFGSITDLSTLGPTKPPEWQKWENVVDAINSAFKVERDTITNYTLLENVLAEDERLLLNEKKDTISALFEILMDHFKGAKEAQDFYEIESKLLSKVFGKTKQKK